MRPPIAHHRTAFQPLLLCVLCALLFTTGCQREATPVPADTAFELTIGGVPIRAEMALTREEQARGLMFRESLAEDTGMLFVFPKARRQSFYMKNTQVPLDIAYLDPDGVLQEIHRGYPYSLDPIPSRSQRIQFVLEMEQGWFADNGIRLGAQLDLDSVRQAIDARGFNPSDFDF
ncbi:MAG: DUF192 domain-containing protein [Verrucomicrobiota bacterium]